VSGYSRDWKNVFREKNIQDVWPLHTDMVKMAKGLGFSERQIINLPDPIHGPVDEFLIYYEWIKERYDKRYAKEAI